MDAREFFDQLPRTAPEADSGDALVYRFDVGPVDDKTSWYAQLADDQMVRCAPQDSVDCSVQCSEEDFMGLMTHRVNALTAYMQGRIGFSGDIGAAQRFHGFVRSHDLVPGVVA